MPHDTGHKARTQKEREKLRSSSDGPMLQTCILTGRRTKGMNDARGLFDGLDSPAMAVCTLGRPRTHEAGCLTSSSLALKA